MMRSGVFCYSRYVVRSLGVGQARQQSTLRAGDHTLQNGIRAAVLKNIARQQSTLQEKHAAVFNLGIFGAGTVGGGVCEIITNQQEFFRSNLGVDLRVSKVCVRDLEKKRDFKVPEGSDVEYTTSIDNILDDPSIDCVVELIGGTTDAKTVCFEAIKKGKHVVTANKALVAEHLTELVELLEANPKVYFGLEAAVCGGIPIISLLQSAFLADSVQQIAGIMNGTTNFMLSKMEGEGADYAVVLKEAQDLGFAEADPSADVDGYDVRAKVSILAKLAFGTTIPLDNVPMAGITGISSDDFAYAKEMNSTIKLMGVARVVDSQLNIFVSPMIVPLNNAIGTTSGATNIVEVRSQSLQTSSFVGEGAGRFPTANSVMSDVLAIAQGRAMARPFQRTHSTLKLETDFMSSFYVRIRVQDQIGVIRRIGELCETHGVSIQALQQTPVVDNNTVLLCLLTDRAKVSQIDLLTVGLERAGFCADRPFAMPLLTEA